MLNHITIMGRLTRDPECHVTGTGVTCCNFTVAVDRDFSPKGQEKEVDFIDCVAWRSTAEFIIKYFQKGQMIVVSGRLQMRKWEDKNQNKRVSAEVVAGNAYFGSSKKSDGASQSAPAYGGQTYDAPVYPDQGFATIDGPDEQLPF